MSELETVCVKPLGHSEWAGEAGAYCCMDKEEGRPAMSVAPGEPTSLWFVNSADVHAVLCCARHCSWGQGLNGSKPTALPCWSSHSYGAADNKQDALVKCRLSIPVSAEENN